MSTQYFILIKYFANVGCMFLGFIAKELGVAGSPTRLWEALQAYLADLVLVRVC